MLAWNPNLLPIWHLSSPWDVLIAFVLVEKLVIETYQAPIYIINVCPNILFNIKIKGHSRLNKVLEIFYWQTKCIQSSSYCITHAYKNRKVYLFSKNCSLGLSRFMVIHPSIQKWHINYVNVYVMFLLTVSKTLVIMNVKSDKFSPF